MKISMWLHQIVLYDISSIYNSILQRGEHRFVGTTSKKEMLNYLKISAVHIKQIEESLIYITVLEALLLSIYFHKLQNSYFLYIINKGKLLWDKRFIWILFYIMKFVISLAISLYFILINLFLSYAVGYCFKLKGFV